MAEPHVNSLTFLTLQQFVVVRGLGPYAGVMPLHAVLACENFPSMGTAIGITPAANNRINPLKSVRRNRLDPQLAKDLSNTMQPA